MLGLQGKLVLPAWRRAVLKHANLNCLGRYSFAVRPPARHARACAHCVTRRLHLDEDDEGTGE